MFDDEFYRKVPTTTNLDEWQSIIDETIKKAPPEKRPGERHKERVPVYIKDVNRTNSSGENKNLVRFENPGDRDVGSFENGIDVRELPPHTLYNPETDEDDLNGGYGRFGIFGYLKYPVWLIDRYVPDSETQSTRQKTHEDIREDSALSSNGGHNGKTAAKRDYVSVLRGKIDRYGWDKSQCELWFKNDIKCKNLSKDQIRDYIADAIRAENAKGRIEWPTDHDVLQLLKDDNKEDVSLLNTTNAETGNQTRFVRSLIPMMYKYNETGKTQEYCLYNTKVTTHQGIDKAHEAMSEMIEKDINLVLEFADQVYLNRRRYGQDHQPCKASYRVTQKINQDNEINKIVEYPD